jgi:hypothetical protein
VRFGAGYVEDVQPLALSWRYFAAFILKLDEQHAFAAVGEYEVGEAGVSGVWGGPAASGLCWAWVEYEPAV